MTMLTVMLSVLTEATSEEKMNGCVDHHHCTCWRWQIIQENLDLCLKTHNQERQQRGDQKISNGKGSLGHWCLLELWLNFKLTWLLSCGVEFSTFVLHCWQNKALYWSKNTQKNSYFDDLCIWKESWADIFVSKSGLGAITYTYGSCCHSTCSCVFAYLLMFKAWFFSPQRPTRTFKAIYLRTSSLIQR